MARFPERPRLTFLLIALGIIILGAIFYWTFLSEKIGLQADETKGSLTITSSAIAYRVGQTFNLDLNVDTDSQEISKIQVHFLNFDPLLLEVQDSNPQTPEVEISPGNLGNLSEVINRADQPSGKIDYLVQTQDAESAGFQGTGRLASITFKAKSAGKAQFSFNFTPGSLGDTDMLLKEGQNDILGSATSSYLTINIPAAQTSPLSQISPLATNLSPKPLRSPSASPDAESSRTANLAMISQSSGWIYLGVPVIITLAIFFFWRRKPRVITETHQPPKPSKTIPLPPPKKAPSGPKSNAAPDRRERGSSLSPSPSSADDDEML